MPLPFLPDHFRCIAEFTNVSSGTPWTITCDYKTDVADTGSAFALADAFGDALIAFAATAVGGSTIAAQMPTSIDLTQVTCYDLGSDDAPFVQSFGVAYGSNAVAAGLPPDLAIVISKRTASRGRSGRGRFYFAGWSAAALDAGGSGLVASVLSTSIVTGANAQLLEITAAAQGYSMAVISQVGGIPISRGVTNLTSDRHWDVQRRRGQA